MDFDWTFRITDIIMIFVVLTGPIIAVQLSEALRSRQEKKARRVHIFRTLMATRSSCLHSAHVECLNLVEIEFHGSSRQDRKVLDCWKVYLSHLNDRNYPQESWEARRSDLIIELLYELSQSLGYNFEKASIKAGAYYPDGYMNAEREGILTRTLWLEILQGRRKLPMEVSIQQNNENPDGKKSVNV